MGIKSQEMRMVEWLHTLEQVAAHLPDNPATFRFHYALRHGSMKFGLYAPSGVDAQEPHKQDELYFVVSGSGWFVKNGDRRPFKTHDVIFVEAGADHRFADFTGDFATWAVFWGPEGGEPETD
jgi:mannose-6-phosphate isomerase-like protein (cupin superfamily)